MKIFNYLSVLGLVLILSSCEDQFTTIREIELPEHERKLTVFAHISGDNGEILVSHSKSIDDNKPYEMIEAEIKLLENGDEFYSFNYQGDGFSGVENFTLPSKLIEGNEYTLIVKNEKFGEVSAVLRLPEKPQVSNIDFTKEGIIDPAGYKSDKLTIDIDDKAGEENFYMIEADAVNIYDRDTFYSLLSLESFDPGIRSFYFAGKWGVIISDKNFDGTMARLILGLNTWYEVSDLRLRIYSITKDHYHFLLSYDQYRNSSGNPFAEPVNVHSNIKNGYGLFQVNSFVEYHIEL